MRSLPKQWWTPRKALFLYFAVAVVAMALTACNKKKDDKKEEPKQQVTLAINQNQQVARTFLNLAMMNNGDIKALVDRYGVSALQMTAYATFGISTLNANGTLSGQDSLLVITITVVNGGQSASANIETRDAQISYTGPVTGGGKVEGYWTIPKELTGTANPAYIGINAVINRVATLDINSQFTLSGQLVSNVDLDSTHEVLAQITTAPVCSLIRDASFLITSQGTALDCGND